jgi:FKBP-type peptidyl-prolyl cis-trans isomerase
VEIGDALLRGGNSEEGDGVARTAASGLIITDERVVTGGTSPGAADGLLVGVHVAVSVEGAAEPLLDTRARGRPIAWVFGKAYAPPVCEGLVEGVEGLKPGAKRRLVVPPSLAFGAKGAIFEIGDDAYAKVPSNATLVYNLEVKSVSPNWS